MLTIGMDIGGTKMAVGALEAQDTLVDYRHEPLPREGYAALLERIRRVAHARGSAEAAPRVLGLAVAAWLSADRETVLDAANLGWGDQRLRADVAEVTGIPTVVHNDGDAAAWGEYVMAGRPARGALVVLTLGTDVGGGVVVDGRLLTGASGVAGELGHLVVDSEGPLCVCGGRGCLAVYASGTALLAAARSRVTEDPQKAPLLASACQGLPEKLRGSDLTHAAEGGDPVALDVIAVAARAVAAASAQISRVIDHRWLVLSGGASSLGGLLADAVERALALTVPIGPTRPHPQVLIARAGEAAGVLGVADLARTAASA